LGFYAIFDRKMCKGCSFKWFFMQKDVFFLFVVWFPYKVWVFMRFLMEKRVKVTLLSDFSCKRIFFCLWFDFRVKFGFLCNFWWKMKSFWSFNCSVLGRCWIWKGFYVCSLIFVGCWSKFWSFMSFTCSFLVFGGEKIVFSKCFGFVRVESVCSGN